MGTYVVTGAALRPGGQFGIGGALKKKLTAQGHEVIAVDVTDAEIIGDLSTTEGRRSIVDEIHRLAPNGIDGLATCAAVSGLSASPEILAEVNFFGTIDVINGCRDLLKANNGSAVIVSSHTLVLMPDDEIVKLYQTLDRKQILDGIKDKKGRVVYASGKQALVHWMRSMVPEYAADGIRLNTVVPGFTDTPMASRRDATPETLKLYDEFQSSIPLGQRMGKPEEVAAGIEFLMSPAASFVCASVLFVDGGHDTNLRPGFIKFDSLSGGTR